MSRYSQIYEKPDSLLRDSMRMRLRIRSIFKSTFNNDQSLALGRHIERKCGIKVVRSGPMSNYVDWDDLFEHEKLRDVLDAVTFGLNFYKLHHKRFDPHLRFRTEIAQVFEEENMGFFIGDDDIVHPRVDAEFERNRASSVLLLDSLSLATARKCVKITEDALLESPINGRAAIRSTFDAIENVFKIAFQDEQSINTKSIQSKIEPLVQAAHEKSPEKQPQIKQVEMLKKWVESAHFYRHQSGQTEISQPSENLTLQMVGTGLALLRWLCSILESNLRSAK